MQKYWSLQMICVRRFTMVDEGEKPLFPSKEVFARPVILLPLIGITWGVNAIPVKVL